MRPIHLYLTALLFLVLTVLVVLFGPDAFGGGVLTGVLGMTTLIVAALGAVKARLESQTEELTNQMSAILGDGDLDIGAILGGAGFGGLLGGLGGVPAEDEDPEQAQNPQQ